jgi:hypothetical protein
MRTASITILAITLAVIAPSAVEAFGQCCMAGKPCCKNGDQYHCENGATTCMSGGNPDQSGGKCGAGNSGWWCGDEPNPSGGGGGGGGGGGSSGTATCGGVTCDQCCINGKCATKAECDDFANKTLATIKTWVIIGAAVAIGCSVIAGIFCCLKKKMVIANRGRGESILEVKSGGFTNLEDNGNYVAPGSM